MAPAASFKTGSSSSSVYLRTFHCAYSGVPAVLNLICAENLSFSLKAKFELNFEYGQNRAGRQGGPMASAIGLYLFILFRGIYLNPF